MPISDVDQKLLWARAAGICSNPECREDLTVILGEGKDHNIGEMAHIIARSKVGPRGVAEGGSNKYGNLILLCPTCHTKIDKGADQYPEEMLQKWKREHENEIREQGKNRHFDSIGELKGAVSNLLQENHILWKELGPHSNTAQSDPGSNLYLVWNARKLSVILPNNAQIIRLIEANSNLLKNEDREAFLQFKIHAEAFEQHQFERLDSYPLFPKKFAERFQQ